MAFTAYVNFQKISGGASPRTPLEWFLEPKLLKINYGGKNCAWKSNKIWCPFPDKNISEYVIDMKQFQRVY